MMREIEPRRPNPTEPTTGWSDVQEALYFSGWLIILAGFAGIAVAAWLR